MKKVFRIEKKVFGLSHREKRVKKMNLLHSLSAKISLKGTEFNYMAYIDR